MELKDVEEEENLQSFKIDPEKIDKIYYVSKTDDIDEKIIKYLMIASIDNSYFINVQAYCCLCVGFNCNKCYYDESLVSIEKNLNLNLLDKYKEEEEEE